VSDMHLLLPEATEDRITSQFHASTSGTADAAPTRLCAPHGLHCVPGRACMPGRLRLDFADDAGGGKGVLPGMDTQVLLSMAMCLRPAHPAYVPEAAVAAALPQIPGAPHRRRAAHRAAGTNLPPGGLPCLACLTPMTLTSHDLTALLPCIQDMVRFAHLSLS